MNHVKTFMTSLLLFLLFQSCISIDTLTPNQTLVDGELLVSKGETFALGFFSPGNSRYRYVGIWYNKDPELTVVWVANRDSPILGSSAALSMKSENLILQGPNQTLYWSTSTNVTDSSTKIAQLLDSGNLVLIQNDTKNVLWQSFDYPTNTILPHMKFGLDRRTGLNRFLTSWKSSDDPGIGNYTLRLDPRGSSQLFLYKGPLCRWRSGPWNGVRFSGVPEIAPGMIFNPSFVDNDDEIYMRFGVFNNSIFYRLVMDESGLIKRCTWRHEEDGRWIATLATPKDSCDNYGHCGVYGNCNPYNVDIFECTCLPGYEPKSLRDWYLREESAGCRSKRLVPSTCEKGDGFVKVTRLKVPDTSIARVDTRMSLKECEQECLRNCSCQAYTSADVRGGGSGCVTWYGDLMDTREYLDMGQDLYIRVDAVELAKYAKKSKGLLGKKGRLSILASSIIVILMVSFACWLARRKMKLGSTSFEDSPREKDLDESRTDPNLHLFELSTIVAATDNFSSANKLGQGGFGSVYKGCLVNGQEFAVKRLSKTSGQGIEEFKNEVTLIAKLQHRNLVRLLGCCIHGEEKMLIYEYLPNKSLDFFIFGVGSMERRKCFGYS